jgi:hypothetical protein
MPDAAIHLTRLSLKDILSPFTVILEGNKDSLLSWIASSDYALLAMTLADRAHSYHKEKE